MQVFKNKTFRRIYSLVTLVVLLVAGCSYITDKFSNVTYQTFFDRDIEEIKSNGEQVDLVFLGASRLYRSMVPSVFEDKLGYDNVLVAATATQPIAGTYYYMKEIIETLHPKEFIIDVTWDRMLNGFETQSALLIRDRLTFKNRILYTLDCFDTDKWKYFLGPCRYRDNILRYEEISSAKAEIEEKNYNMYDPAKDYYADKGFVYSYDSFETGSIPYVYGLEFEYSDADIRKENVEYLDKCIQLCKDNGIKVSLVTAPCSMSILYLVGGYDDAVEWYKEYAKEQGVSYYNLNYLKGREDFLPDEMMLDEGHTNGEGANIISGIYADILLKERAGEDASEYFYANLAELKQDVHRVVAVSADIKLLDSDFNAEVSFDCLHNDGIEPLYRVDLIMFDGTTTVLSDWSYDETAMVTLPGNGGYIVKARAKSGIDGDIEAARSYFYY